MKKVYLAGPITGISYGEAVDWREHARKFLREFGIDGYSPMRAKDYLRGEKQIASFYQADTPLSTSRGIMTRDRWDVRTADLVLVNVLHAQKVSIGTVMEIAWADMLRTPVVLVAEEQNVHAHPMISEATGFRVDTLEAGLALAVQVLLP
jgi:nucleoside 2-deoxyribosyltransferase